MKNTFLQVLTLRPHEMQFCKKKNMYAVNGS